MGHCVSVPSLWLAFFFLPGGGGETTFFCLSCNGCLFLSLLMTFPFEQFGLFQADPNLSCV